MLKRVSSALIYPVLIILVGVAVILGVSLGGVKVPASEVIPIILNNIVSTKGLFAIEWPQSHEVIILTLRLPRVILAGLVGAGLALAGATFQGLFRNPMADPYVIGVSSGAALGAVVAILLFSKMNIIIPFQIPVFSFVFAIFTVFLVYNLARIGGKVPVMNLLLAGVAISALFSALVSLCMFFSGKELHHVVFWLMGGLSGRGWNYVYMFLPYGIIGSGVIFIYARELNAMLLGEEPAQHLGVDVEMVKRRLLVAAALLTGVCVSVSGLIGFIGLITPHIVRIILGPDHRILLPTVAFIGALFLIIADVLARIVIAPGELPVGIVTALVGSPFFIYLLRRQKATMF